LQAEVNWEGSATRALPVGFTYPGDAISAIATCTGKQMHKVTLTLPATGHSFCCEIGEAIPAPALRAWAGQQIYAQATAAREAIALRYSLITPDTKAVLVKVRAEDDRIEGLPEVKPVAHMMPTGMLDVHPFVMAAAHSGSAGACSAGARPPASAAAMGRRRPSAVAAKPSPADYLDIPHFLRRNQAEEETAPPPRLDDAQKQALADALATFLLQGERTIAIGDVVSRIDPQYRDGIQQWLEFWHSRGVSLSLLQQLIAEGASVALDDAQEAAYAVITVEKRLMRT